MLEDFTRYLKHLKKIKLYNFTQIYIYVTFLGKIITLYQCILEVTFFEHYLKFQKKKIKF